MIEIPGYTVLRLLGHGGMATVYLALQQSLHREVALKILSPALAQDSIATERFLREARVSAKLHHPHIVAIYDVGLHNGVPYMSIAYEPGGTVARKTDAREDPKIALRIIRDIASALDYAHSQGVIHRDVKPENILLRNDGTCVLSDFGIAHAVESQTGLTREGTSVGTPHYMSPEQLRGEHVDGRTDLYSLGVVFYQLLTGDLPYQGTDGWAIGMQHISAPVPHLPAHLAHLQTLLDALLAKGPGRRLQTGAEVVQWVDARLSGQTPAMTVAMPTPVPAISTTGSRATAASIALLPFADMSQGKDQEYLADGLSEELLNLLSKVPGLFVASRSSAFNFKGKGAKLADIGRELKVATVLEGSVRKFGERVRISVQLINVEDGFQRWSETYDRQLTDVFAVQDEIAALVMAELKIQLLPRPAPDVDPELARQEAREGQAQLDAAEAKANAAQKAHALQEAERVAAEIRARETAEAEARRREAAESTAAEARQREAAALAAAEALRQREAAERAAAEARQREAVEAAAAAARQREAAEKADAEARQREAAETAAAEARQGESAARAAAAEAAAPPPLEREPLVRLPPAAAAAAAGTRDPATEFASAFLSKDPPEKIAAAPGAKREAAPKLFTPLRAGVAAVFILGLVAWLVVGYLSQRRQADCQDFLSQAQSAADAADFGEAATAARAAGDSCKGDQLTRLQELNLLIGEGTAKAETCGRADAKARDFLAQAQPALARAVLEQVRPTCASRPGFAELEQRQTSAESEAGSLINRASSLMAAGALDEARSLLDQAMKLDAHSADATKLRERLADRNAKPPPAQAAPAPAPILSAVELAAIQKEATQNVEKARRAEQAKLAAEAAKRAQAQAAARAPVPAPAPTATTATPTPPVAQPPAPPLPPPPTSHPQAARAQLVPISTPQPAYPTQALRSGIAGQVTVSFTVNTDGSVGNVRIVSAKPRGTFDRAVLGAVAGWRFQPIEQAQTVTRQISFQR